MAKEHLENLGIIATDSRSRAYVRFLLPNARYAVERNAEGLFSFTELIEVPRHELKRGPEA